MQLGIVGLGRMGANMARRLITGGHQCVVFNRSPQKVEELVKEKAIGASSLAGLVQTLQNPRAVWLFQVRIQSYKVLFEHINVGDDVLVPGQT